MPGSARRIGPRPNMALQRTRRPRIRSGRSLRSLGSPLNARSLGSTRKSLFIAFSLSVAGCVSADLGRLRVITRGELGEVIPGIEVTAGANMVKSQQRMGAQFDNLEPGEYVVDARAPGMRSCGPLSVRVRGDEEAVVALVMRVAEIRDYVHVTGSGAPDPDKVLVSELAFRPCPGRPESALVVRTYASGRIQEAPF